MGKKKHNSFIFFSSIRKNKTHLHALHLIPIIIFLLQTPQFATLNVFFQLFLLNQNNQKKSDSTFSRSYKKKSIKKKISCRFFSNASKILKLKNNI